MSQLSLLDPPPQPQIHPAPEPTTPKLTIRQQATLDALTQHPDGLEASEAGAIAHELKEGHWAHSREQRCQFCASDGKDILRALEAKGLARYIRGRRLWYPVGQAAVEPEISDADWDGSLPVPYNVIPY